MTITAQTVVARAQAFNPLNTALTSDRAEMLSRIRADQQALFTATSHLARDRFKTTVTVTSSTGSSGRTIDLSALSLPLERILRVTLASEEVHQVDELDQEGELAPRYYVQGLTLIEVGNDWGSAGAKSLSLTYAYGATDIDPDGAYTQTVTVPDAWIDLLVLPLAMYLHSKDPGRDPSEYEKLAAALDERQQAYLEHLKGYGGVSSTRFDIPAPRVREQKQ